jgi:hypothetical protein
MAGTTITKALYNSSAPVQLNWRSFASGAANNYINVSGVEGSKLIILVASESTAVAAGTTFYLGASDSATTGSSYTKNYSASKLNRMKLKLAKAVKASAFASFRATGSTKLMAISVLGPFETARFQDTDGFINYQKAITGSTVAEIAAILLP